MKELINKYFSGFIDGTKTMFKEFFSKETNKKQRANMWTFSRLIISIPILICSIIAIINISTPLLITCGSLAGLGAVTDYFDGRSAKKHKSTSEYGKKLDQVVDKIFSIIIGINLSIINPLYLLTLLGEGVIALCNVPFAAKYKNLKDYSEFIGRVKQWPLGLSFILGYLAPLTSGLNIAATISIIVTFIFQLLTASTYLKRNIDDIKYIKKLKKKNPILFMEEEFEKTNNLENTIGEKDKNSNSCDKIKDVVTMNNEIKENSKNFREEYNNNNSENTNNTVLEYLKQIKEELTKEEIESIEKGNQKIKK